jgi:chaperonin GroES
MTDISKSIQPLGAHILVKPVKEDKKTESGIIIPDTAEKEKPQKGKVVSLGTGKKTKSGKTIPFEVKKNDTVIFKKYTPEEIEIGDEMYYILTEEDILAILK